MFKVGIFGDTGMVGQEIGRILKCHDRVEVVFRKNSKRQEGKLEDCQLVFLATKDLESMEYAKQASALGKKVIDMSGAFRLPRDMFEKWYGLKHTAPELLKDAVFGLPAYFRKEIAGASLVANPGCYPTSVILALKPLKGMVCGHASIVSTSGNSGARREIEGLSNEITYSYGTKHKHVPEMMYYTGFEVDFTPIVMRSVFSGINTNIRIELCEELKRLSPGEAEERLSKAVEGAYCSEDAVYVVKDSREKQWGTRDIVGSHKVIIKIRVDGGYAYICSMVDNLGKGAASQGVENMNIMLGLPRLYAIDAVYSTGLNG